MLIECAACSGTGLYRGFAEPKGVAVICNRCGGSGAGLGTKPFTGRHMKTGITRVINDGGLWFARKGVSPTDGISIQEFYEKVPEASDSRPLGD